MKKKKAIRTLIEIDEVFQNVEPGHFFVVRIFTLMYSLPQSREDREHIPKQKTGYID